MKKVFIFIMGLAIVALLVLFNHYTKVYFLNNNQIMDNLNKLKQLEVKLNYAIVSDSVYLYKNFDDVVLLESKIDKTCKILLNDPHFKKHKKAYKEFLQYKIDIYKKIELVYRLEMLIAPIKNASMYLSDLVVKLPKLPIKYRPYKWEALKIISDLYLSKNSFDLSFLKQLKTNLNRLKGFDLEDESILKFNGVLQSNIKVFLDYFPYFVEHMNEVLKYKTKYELNNVIKSFLISTNQKLRIITVVSVLLILFVISSIFVIYFLFHQVEEENKKLEKMLVTDNLTKLFNRYKLEQDIKKTDNLVLFIVDVDRFKYYNDFYGIQAGDFILKEVAKHIKEIFPKSLNANFYRIGADEFCILIDKKGIDYIQVAKDIEEYFYKLIIYYGEIDFNISVSVGISDVTPLIETADIILKEIKKDETNNSIGIYDPNAKYIKNIKENIDRLILLKETIKNSNIIPYFQPLFDNKTGKVEKYEVLARVKDGDKIMSIYPFLKIAQENKLYKYITQSIYKKSFEKFKNTDVRFSLNVSLEDIENEEIMEFIKECLDKYATIIPNVTFEILESDAVEDYESLQAFIKFVKSKGAKVAIDDFGSGYSNFAHILNLDIDFMKIDGSLIKHIADDEKTLLIVETIVEFAKKIKMKTVGEFVHNKAVLDKVKELGIDYTQGFYLGEPKEDIL